MRTIHWNARRGARGTAYIMALGMLMILITMVAITLRANGQRRTALRMDHDRARALCLAESAVAEAMHRIVSGETEGTLADKLELGRYQAEWALMKGDADVFDIRGVGVMPTRIPAPMRREVAVRVRRVTGADGKPALERVSWSAR